MHALRKSIQFRTVLAALALVWLGQTALAIHEEQLSEHKPGVECNLCLHAIGDAPLLATATLGMVALVWYLFSRLAVVNDILPTRRDFSLALSRGPPAYS